MRYWEIIADNLSRAGWSCGCVSLHRFPQQTKQRLSGVIQGMMTEAEVSEFLTYLADDENFVPPFP